MKLETKKKVIFLSVYIVMILLVFFGAAEILLRLKKYPVWTLRKNKVRVDPGGKMYIKDPVLGFDQMPGNYYFYITPKELFYRTHLKNTHSRMTYATQTSESDHDKPQVWLFGCSFTYGWLFLQDSATFPWLLQEKLPRYEIVNYGISGFSNLQSMLQCRQALDREKRKPKLIILDYASFHDERNTCSGSWRKSIVPVNELGALELPYARLDDQNKLHYYMGETKYHPLPFIKHSTFFNFLDTEWDKLEDRHNRNHEVTKALSLDFQNLCQTYQVPFMVAGLTMDAPTKDILQFCKEHGILAADISVDMSILSNTNFPHDSHPSLKGNQQFADKLYSSLTAIGY